MKRKTFSEKRREWLDPDEWMVKLLKLSPLPDHPVQPGAVIIQVDGLGQAEFARALHRREMPFLAGLLKKESYREYAHYCGQPSSTPAVQGALFYGVKNCVPAFGFKDRQTGKLFNMLFPGNAAEIEGRISHHHAHLLQDGSAYGNIFTGGAKEAHFCVSSIGWGTLLEYANPVAIAVFVLMHLHILVRFVMLTFLEVLLALYDSIRGFLEGKNVLAELRYIFFRVVACVILREVIGAGAKIDIARGLPVIHLNLVGYDEQAHHRGPRSKFAHWSLRAIDSVIKAVWKAAKRSFRRDYEVFIYSDHGQEETTGYEERYGRTVQDAVNEVLKEERLCAELGPAGGYCRAGLLRNRPVPGRPPERRETAGPVPPAVITALGPVGHVYPPDPLSREQKERIAGQLIAVAKIPLVLTAGGAGKALAWNAQGRFVLPRDAEEVLGRNHPFLHQAAQDLADLCHQENAGDLIISGFRKQGGFMTFFPERGSHGGPGPHETAGFALLPPGSLRPDAEVVTTKEIRAAVLRVAEPGTGRAGQECRMPRSGDPATLKIMSYNVHACQGLDGRVRPDRIARVIARHQPDIIALQEIDADETHHQAKIVADLLSLNYHYHSAVLLKTGQHGNAVFSRFEMKLVKRGSLPSLHHTPLLEKRGAMWVEVNVRGCRVQIFNTHLSLYPPEGLLQAQSLLGPEWLGDPACRGPVIVCGDFNSLLDSRVCRALGQRFHGIHFDVPAHRRLKTFPSHYPLGLVDHIFLGPGVQAVATETPGTHLEKTASDHLPLIAQVRIGSPVPGSGPRGTL